MTTIDPLRRRLTVAPGAAQGVGDVGAVGRTWEPPDYAAILEQANAQDKAHLFMSSKTDSNLKHRASFADKDDEIRSADDTAARSWLDRLGFAVCCRKGKKPEAPNQDSYAVLGVEGEYLLLSVFDGHGPSGHDISEFVRLNLPARIVTDPEFLEDTSAVLAQSFDECQTQIEDSRELNAMRSGTTATVVVWDMKKDIVTIAHCGDSRSVLGWQIKDGEPMTEDMTIDHKPNLPEEQARIESQGGRVIFDGFYNHRVFAKNGNYPGLNMSRAFGDVTAHREAGLTAAPDIKVVDVSAHRKLNQLVSEPLTLLICSDGVWEFIDSTDAYTYVNPDHAMKECMQSLAQASYYKWMADSQGEISDDITAMCIRLGPPS